MMSKGTVAVVSCMSNQGNVSSRQLEVTSLPHQGGLFQHIISYLISQKAGQILCLLVVLGMSGCGSADEKKQDRQAKEKEFVSDADAHFSTAESASRGTPGKPLQSSEFNEEFGVINVNAEMFDSLAPDVKASLYRQFRRMHERQKGTAGQSRYHRVRHILAQILRHPASVSVSIRNKIKSYLKYLWLFGGNRHPVTSERIRPTFIPGELGAATQIALRNGASIDLSSVPNTPLSANKIEQLEALLAEIRPYIFGDGETDSESGEPASTVQDDGSDMVQTRQDTDSSHQHGVPPQDGEGKLSGSAVMRRPKDVSNGAEQLGEEDATNPSVGLLYFEDLNFKGILEKLATLADYCDQKVREVGGTKSTVRRQPAVPFVVGHVLDLPGERSPLVPVNADIMGLGMASREINPETGGTMNVLWLNVNEAFESKIGGKVARTFSPTRSVANGRQQRRQLVSVAYHALRNLVGYGADGTEKQAPGWLKNRLGDQHELFLELRADLAALYLAFDDEVRKSGLIPDDATRHALLDEYVLSTVERIGAGGDPKTDLALKVRLIVVNFLIEAGVVTAKAKTPGNYQVAVVDYSALRTPVIQLLGRVRNIRFLGDGVKAAQLADTFGNIPAGWRNGMIRRFTEMDFPTSFVLLLPVIEKRSATKTNGQYVVRPPASFFDRNMFVASFADL